MDAGQSRRNGGFGARDTENVHAHVSHVDRACDVSEGVTSRRALRRAAELAVGT